MTTLEVLRLAAFTTTPDGGNPAGVVLDASGLDDDDMLAIARQVGYSETAFLFPRDSDGRIPVRYFSVRAEVPFCGHATIAAGVAWGERHGAGRLMLGTGAGEVPVDIEHTAEGWTASLTSVEPSFAELASADRERLLALLRLTSDVLDPAVAPGVAYAGLWHPVLVLGDRAALRALSYDYDGLDALMADRGWTTVAVIWRENNSVLHARNLFPPGGVVEDPATGSAAAAVGAYLRETGVLTPPTTITIHQGEDLGRPSVLTVAVGTTGGLRVRGAAVAMA